MENIHNKIFIIVSPKKALFEWIKLNVNDEFGDEDASDMRTVYTADIDYEEFKIQDKEHIIRRYYKQILDNELSIWMDEIYFPGFNIKLFNKWFNCHCTILGYALKDNAIEDMTIVN